MQGPPTAHKLKSAVLATSRIIAAGDFPGGPVVKNLHSNAEDVGSILAQGTKIPHAAGQLSMLQLQRLHVATREKTAHPQRRPNAAKNKQINTKLF